MTNLQVVKALDKQIDASFKRSASSPEEQAIRKQIRAIQEVFRAAHNANVVSAKVARATNDLLRQVTPAMACELKQILARYQTV